jgi:hypothetical protein
MNGDDVGVFGWHVGVDRFRLLMVVLSQFILALGSLRTLLRIQAFGARKRSLFVSLGLSLTTDRCLPISRSVFTLSAQLVTAGSLAKRSGFLALCVYSPAIATTTRHYRDSD